MATVIRLQRGGRKKRPFYNIVVLDSRKRRDGAFIEKLGYFDPCKSPEVISLDTERAEHWMGLGAQVSPRVASLIRRAGAGPEAAGKAKAQVADRAAAEAGADAGIEEEAKEAVAETEGATERAAEDAPAEETAADAGEAGAEAEKPAGKEEDKAEA